MSLFFAAVRLKRFKHRAYNFETLSKKRLWRVCYILLIHTNETKGAPKLRTHDSYPWSKPLLYFRRVETSKPIHSTTPIY